MALPLKSGADLYNNQALRMRLHNLGADPTEVGAGLIYFNTSTGLNTSQKVRLYTGSAWKTIAFSEDLDVASNADFLALKNKVDAFLDGGVDADNVLENLAEVQKFLDNYSGATSLSQILDTKLDTSGGTLTGLLLLQYTNPRIAFKSDANTTLGAVGFKDGVLSANITADNKWYTLLHSGNVGEYALKKVENVTSLNTNAGEFFYSGFRPSHIPYGNYVGGITLQTFLDAVNDYRTQLAFSTDAKGFVRSYTNGSWSDWKTIAFTDSNVASATKLETARKLWGNNFDGTADVAAQLTFNANDAALSAWKKDGSSTAIFLQVNPDRHLLIGQGTARENGGLYLYGNDIRMCYGNAGSSSNISMLINSSGNVTIGGSDTAGTDYKLRVDGKSRFTDRVSVASLRIIPVGGSFAADFAMDGSSLTLNCELKFTNVTASDICSGIAAAFKTSLAQAENLIARNIILGASSGSASNLALNFQKYTSISNTAPNGLTTLMTLTTDGNLGIGTSNPTEKLHVVGNLHVTGNIIADGEVSAGGAAEEGGNAGGGGAFHSESIAVGATQTTIAHGLGTDDIVVSIYEKDGVSGRWSIILTDVEIVDANNIIVSFGSATSVEHKVVIMGAVA